MQTLEVYLWIEASISELNLPFDEEVKRFGFIKNEEEPCVYKKASGNTHVFLVLYVDDILLIENDIPIVGAKIWLLPPDTTTSLEGPLNFKSRTSRFLDKETRMISNFKAEHIGGCSDSSRIG